MDIEKGTIRKITTALLCAVLSACGGGSSGSGAAPSVEDSSNSLLRSVSSDEEFVARFKSAYTQTNGNRQDQQPPLAAEGAAADNSESPSGYSSTYTLEDNVDEFDVLKYDGDYLYIVPTIQQTCCFISQGNAAFASDALVAPQNPQNPGSIRILSTNPDDASAQEVTTIPLADGEYVQGLYVQNNRLISIGTTQFYGSYGDAWQQIAPWGQQSVAVKIYDTSNIDNISQLWNISIEGGYVDSRRIGDILYLISRHTPYWDNIYYYPASQQEANANKQTLAGTTSADIIPRITVNEQTKPLLTAEDCLITRNDKADEYAYPVITSITAIPLNNPNSAQTTCYDEDANGIYMSANALYLSQARYGSSEGQTRVHKFALGAGKPDYRGSADIAGSLWNRGQVDFRMSEKGNQLRVVTTRYTGDSDDLRDHQLTILQEATDDLRLDQVSTLPNSSRPAELGKPNESLYGVRFLDDRLYLVSFEQIDPLYVLDLSNTTDPYIAGELEIPGFSDFLHPVNDNLLLGVGQSAQNQGLVKLSLFNVSDISNPSELTTVLLGKDGGWNYSEAQYNRHAFTYLAQADGTDRLTVPVQTSYNSDQGTYISENRLYLMEINGKSNPAAASLDLIGNIIASPSPAENWYGGQNRSVIHDDAVYFLSGDYIWSALWADPSTQIGPQ
ncbi:beta-propeller domain-containing protein [Zhongshania aquimaris]|uniref:Beta-propeller domain-containing protein n=1 Tax=Zhongshania aquimaris TaxID=2857107 RepID=A0ABS6VT64_9GAMM|nr:beta-propeller domain-containing protein [Zhongshania aquimaris]MBW2941508.1 beta-propeller domain-containing protein [Zhongshania aquimaris]